MHQFQLFQPVHKSNRVAILLHTKPGIYKNTNYDDIEKVRNKLLQTKERILIILSPNSREHLQQKSVKGPLIFAKLLSDLMKYTIEQRMTKYSTALESICCVSYLILGN